ncbi:isopeptide-forming domain-containing fimbrial protein [Bifidobacterium adolescentis]|uniref:isopeptide-forming domain-containing fimbrial protein n=1 Tax=Bifidobacterium adolescentis TaxID=1680 RepID=UPI000E4C2B7B|nr:isopeptide-forming domain-containing fimbrial protein [Bifidobacterium adolescentis]RGJ33310.1 isopeptide-forming domain-containing fimbrial protein [Bifidobacterium adolescentis]
MNKVLKGLVAVAATAAMAVAGFAGASTAMAAEGDVTITIGSETTPASVGDVYAGYRLFDETEATVGEKTNVAYQKRTNWNHYDKVAEAINDVDSSATLTADSKVDDFVAAIGKFDSTKTKRFAENLYKSLKEDGVAADANSAAVAAGAFSTTLSGPQGYYLIVQTTAANDAGKTMSAVIVNTAGQAGVTVSPKKDTVTVSKKVQENMDGVNNPASEDNWGTAADYNIGDYVKFQLTGSLPTDYADYTSYEYTFHDTADQGLTFVNDTTHPVKVYAVNDNNKVELKQDTLTGYQVLTSDINGETFNVKFADLKKAQAEKTGDTVNITSSTQIVVEYYAQLNENAVLGSNGNQNKVYLQFSNNKYGKGTGKTEEHKVTVFTFKLEVTKYGKTDSDKEALNGAGFTLYKATKVNPADSDYAKVGDEVQHTNGNVFDFTGLDSGYYKIVETTTPKGYNTIDPITFTVTATYNSADEPGTLTDLTVTDVKVGGVASAEQTFTVNRGTGEAGTAQIKTDVVDIPGSKLPSTGGMGTVLLYVAGIAVFVLAGATLVMALRRRNA